MSILQKLDELKEIRTRIFTESFLAGKTENENNLIVLLCNVYVNVIYVMECYQCYLAVKMDKCDLHIFIELKFPF